MPSLPSQVGHPPHCSTNLRLSSSAPAPWSRAHGSQTSAQVPATNGSVPVGSHRAPQRAHGSLVTVLLGLTSMATSGGIGCPFGGLVVEEPRRGVLSPGAVRAGRNYRR